MAGYSIQRMATLYNVYNTSSTYFKNITSVVIGDKIYYGFGTIVSDGANNNTWYVYDTITYTLTTLASPSETFTGSGNLASTMAFVVGNTIWVVTHTTITGNSPTVWAYDIAANTWVKKLTILLYSATSSATSGCLGADGTSIYLSIHGNGYSTGGICKYNTLNNTASIVSGFTQGAAALRYPIMFSTPNKLFVVSGNYNNPPVTVTTGSVLDLGTNLWSTMASPPSTQSSQNFTVCAVNGADVYVPNARWDNTALRGNVYKYNISTNIWSLHLTLPQYRNQGVVIYDIAKDRSLFIGGDGSSVPASPITCQELWAYAYWLDVPTNLTGTISNGTIVLNWTDTSTEENVIMVERRADNEAVFSKLVELPADTVTYTDTAVVLPTRSYNYRLKYRKDP
jgi:hypothetical protein